jgi:peptidoglycan/xylan/chitin deacetylase (PgdA/CDA1 family)
LGLAKDFWRDFDDRYLELEKGLPSTFFVIPFPNRSGMSSHGPAPALRAARYGAQDIASTLQKLLAAGCEVGLHGIDAWRDSSCVREELEEIRRLTSLKEIGVRVHWLYYDGQQSPPALEKAGAAYDSTMGYNETVGYRAGTTQAYKPLQSGCLLELPLHIMDTAMFYRAYLGLSPRQASTRFERMVEHAARFGGCLTINWHDRSLAPERQWGACYDDLLQKLKDQSAWFATAGQAVAWFRKRRSVVFQADGRSPETVRARVPADYGDYLPALRLRIHRAHELSGLGALGSEHYLDMPFDERVEAGVLCEVGR